jgi:hypothetical protein
MPFFPRRLLLLSALTLLASPAFCADGAGPDFSHSPSSARAALDIRVIIPSFTLVRIDSNGAYARTNARRSERSGAWSCALPPHAAGFEPSPTPSLFGIPCRSTAEAHDPDARLPTLTYAAP